MSRIKDRKQSYECQCSCRVGCASPLFERRRKELSSLLGRREIIKQKKRGWAVRLSEKHWQSWFAVQLLGAGIGRFGAMGSAHLNTQPCSWGPLWMQSPESTAGWRRRSPMHQVAAPTEIIFFSLQQLESCLLSKSWRRLYGYDGNTAWSRECGFFFFFFFFLGKKGGFRF